jgi:putative endonuclease
VYILANRRNGTLYVGVTSDLAKRLREHLVAPEGAFTARYKVTSLVYWESFHSIAAAIRREKVLKRWSRQRKLAAIENLNPEWKDFTAEVLDL